MLLGREREIEALERNYALVQGGSGRIVLVRGEAGIGKTTLVDEFLSEKDCTMLKGTCSPILTPPLHPFREALKARNLDHLLGVPRSPRILMLYAVHDTGLLLAKVERQEFSIDPDIFTSMLTAVSMFVKDSIGDIGEGGEYLEELRYGDYNLVIRKGSSIMLVAILEGKSNEFLYGDLERAVGEIEDNFGPTLSNWSGNMEEVKGIGDILRGIIESGKYEGQIVEEGQNWNFENVRLGLGRLGRERPVCVFIDDIQWADEATISLLHYLARSDEDRIFVIATYRSEEKNEAIENLEDAVIREGVGEIIPLEPLRRDDVLGILEGMFEGEVDIDLLNYVYDVSEGIPLNVIVVAEMLLEENLLEMKDGRLSITGGVEELPEVMRSIIARRIRSLDDDAREVLEFAAVLGSGFTAKLLACGLEMKRVKVIRILRGLSARGLIRRGERGYEFHHDYMRDVIYGEIDEEMKEEYHSLAAECIEDVDIPDEVRVTILADHYYRAGKCREALEYSGRALEILMASGSPREALKLAERIIECSKKIGDYEKVRDMLITMGDIQAQYGEIAKAVESYRRSLEIEETYLARVRLGTALLKLGRYDEAEEEFRRAEGIAPEREEVLINLANVEMKRGNMDRAEELLKEYVEWARDKPRELMNGYKALGVLYSMSSRLDEAMEYLELALEEARKLEDRRAMADVLHNIGVVHYLRGEVNRALDTVAQVVAIRESMADLDGYLKAANLLGLIHWKRGDIRNSEKYFNLSSKYARLMGRRDALASALLNMGMMKYYLRDGDSSSYLEKALAIYRELGSGMWIAESLLYLASALLESGDTSRAGDLVAEAKAIAESLEMENYGLWARILELRIDGDAKSLEKFANGLKDHALRGIAYQHLWRMTGKEKHRERAIEEFREAGFEGAIVFFR